MLRHRQVVIAAIAITGLIGYALPLNQFAQAQSFQGLAAGIIGNTFASIFGSSSNQDLDGDYGNRQIIEQPIDQEIEQKVDQSERNDQSNTNTQAQFGFIDQDIVQRLIDGDDKASAAARAASESESWDAWKIAFKHSSFSSSSGDATAEAEAENSNEQEAENNAQLIQGQQQTVTQSNTATFGDDKATLEGTNVAVPIAIPINIDEEYGFVLDDTD